MSSSATKCAAPLTIAAGFVFSTCDYQDRGLEETYASAAVAAGEGLFERDVLPRILQPDVGNIRYWEEPKTNQQRGSFALNDAVLHRMQTQCSKADATPRPLPHPYVPPAWWPDALRSDRRGREFAIFQCGTFWLAAHPAKQMGYFWRAPRSQGQ